MNDMDKSEEKGYNKIIVQLAVMSNDMAYLRERMNNVDEKVSSGYVTKEEFDPVKKLVYSLVTAVGTTLIGIGMYVLFQNGKG